MEKVNLKVEKGVQYVLEGLSEEFGLDITDVNFQRTPFRVAKMYQEFLGGLREVDKNVSEILSKKFPATFDEMLFAKNVRVSSLCPHHLLPVEYNITVAYLPEQEVLGISKLVRFVKLLASRLVLQEVLTHDITAYLMKHLQPKGCGAFLKGRHSCMISRGVEQKDSVILTSSLQGNFRDLAVREEFLRLALAEEK